MNLINRIKVGWKNEEFSKIRKYIRKPAYITFCDCRFDNDSCYYIFVCNW